jgi:hypothetical protein
MNQPTKDTLPMNITRRWNTIGPWLALLGGYLALAVGITWPLVTDLSGQLIGHSTGDAYEMGHHIWWFTHALRSGEPLFYQTLMAYPEGIQGISLWSNPLQFFPAWLFALVMPVAAAYNLAILLTMALNGLAMAYLVRRIGQREGWEGAQAVLYGPAVLAGVAFEAFPVFQGHLFGGHAGLLVMWPVPLFIEALYRLQDRPTGGHVLRAALWCFVSPWGHTVQAICVLMPVTGLFVLAQLWRRAWRAAALTALSAGLGMLMLAVFVLPVLADTFADDTYTGDQGYVMFSADLLGTVTPSFLHPVLGQLPYTHRVLGVNLTEGFTYYGAAAAALTVVALLRRRGARWWGLLALVSAVLGLGPLVKLFDQPLVLRLDNFESFITLPWAFIYDLPGFSLARAPGRFNFALALAAAVLVGYGMAVLWRGRARVRWAVLLGFAAVMVFEYQAAWPFPTVPAGIPQRIANLRNDDTVRAVFHVPWGNLLAAKEAIYVQTAYQKPMLAGQVTRRTPVSAAKLTVLEATLDPALLRLAGADMVIAHKNYLDPALEQRLRDSFGDPIVNRAGYLLFAVPFADGPPGLLVVAPPEWADGAQRTADRADTYLYAPAAGEYVWRGTLQADQRDVTLTLDGAVLAAWPVSGTRTVEVRFDVPAAGYYTVRLALDTPCPTLLTSSALTCRGLSVQDVTVEAVQAP